MFLPAPAKRFSAFDEFRVSETTHIPSYNEGGKFVVPAAFVIEDVVQLCGRHGSKPVSFVARRKW